MQLDAATLYKAMLLITEQRLCYKSVFAFSLYDLGYVMPMRRPHHYITWPLPVYDNDNTF